MSSTSTRVAIPSGYWSTKRYAIAVALVLALVIAAFSAGSLLAGSEPTSPAAAEGAGGTDGNARTTDAGGGAGVLRGRIQP